MKARPLAALAITAALASAGACSGGGRGADQTGYVPGEATVTFVQPGDREPAPDLAGELVGGGAYSLADERGDDVVVVNVWGSWCPPCRAEADALEEVFQDTRDEGVQFLGLNTRDQEERADAFVAQHGISYPSIVDDGLLQAGFRTSLPVAAIPTTYVIDRSGRVAARAVTEVTYSTLLELVERVLAEDETAGLDQ